MDSVDLEQKTSEWRDARLGCATASEIHKILSKPKSRDVEESAGYSDYKWRLACEIFEGKIVKDSDFDNFWTRRGEELEPDARSEYELRNGVMVQTVGFIKHADIPRYGCSPDGLVGDDGMIQIKCQKRSYHMECWQNGVPKKFILQIACELSVTGRKWSDFVAYHPDVPEPFKLYVKRIQKELIQDQIEKIEAKVRVFTQEVDALVMAMKTQAGLTGQLEASIALVSSGNPSPAV